MDCRWVGLLLVFVMALYLCFYRKHPEGFVQVDTPQNLPRRSSRYFQFSFPSLKVENRYHQHMMEDCQGNYNDYHCRRRSYVKAMKNGTVDRADYICGKYEGEEAYYNCLDAVYGNYLWTDHFAGVDKCVCNDGKGQYTGAASKDGCYCPAYRPPEDRTPHDQFDQPAPYTV